MGANTYDEPVALVLSLGVWSEKQNVAGVCGLKGKVSSVKIVSMGWRFELVQSLHQIQGNLPDLDHILHEGYNYMVENVPADLGMGRMIDQIASQIHMSSVYQIFLAGSPVRRAWIISCSKEIRQDELRIEFQHGENLYTSDLILESVLGGLRSVLLYRQRIPDKRNYKEQKRNTGSGQDGSSAYSSLSQDVSRGGGSSLGGENRMNSPMNNRPHRENDRRGSEGRAGRGIGTSSRGRGFGRENRGHVMTDGLTDYENLSGDMDEGKADAMVVDVSDAVAETLTSVNNVTPAKENP
jgi:hypothetical protein